VAALELSVWWYFGTRPRRKNAAWIPSFSAGIDSERQGVAKLQFEYGSATWQSRWG
jgi:hypothetical protein